MKPRANFAQQPISMLDLRAQYAAIREEVRAALDEVLESQRFILGPQLDALEQEVARYCGRRHGVGVASGTDALILALRACHIGPGDEVVVPGFSFIATAGAVSALGARPVFADIDPRTFNLDPAQLEARIAPRTRAVIVVHLYGLPAAMEPILGTAARHKVTVIEDNAQAIGATYQGRKTGSLGQLGCLSFYPSKNLGAYGDAGMVVTDSEEMAARIRALRHHGQTRQYVSAEQGWNSRLDEIQAAVLRVKMRHLEDWKAARQACAKQYSELLSSISGVVTPLVPAGCEHVYHQYTIRIEGAAHGRFPRRDRVQQYLAQHDVASAVYYPVPLHLQPIYASLGGKRGDLPASECAAQEVLSLPIYPELRLEQVERVAQTLAAAMRSE